MHRHGQGLDAALPEREVDPIRAIADRNFLVRVCTRARPGEGLSTPGDRPVIAEREAQYTVGAADDDRASRQVMTLGDAIGIDAGREVLHVQPLSGLLAEDGPGLLF